MISIRRAIWASRFYYWRWLRVAFGPSYHYADIAGFFVPAILLWIGVAIAKAIGFKISEETVSNLSWQIPIGLMVAIFIVRLVPAPYWMHKEDEAKREKERIEEKQWRDGLDAKMDEMKSLLMEKHDRAEKKSCLAVLLRDGKNLKDRTVQDADQLKVWTSDYREWNSRLETEIGDKFSASESLRVSNVDYDVVKVPGVIDGNHQRAICRMAAILQDMQATSQRLSPDA
jgi:hypothetical protein